MRGPDGLAHAPVAGLAAPVALAAPSLATEATGGGSSRIDEAAGPDAPPDHGRPSGDFLRLIPHEHARRHLLLSAGCADGVETLLVCGRTPAWAAHNAGVRLGRRTLAVQMGAEELAARIDAEYTLYAERLRAGAPGDADGADGKAASDPGPLAATLTSIEAAGDVEAEMAEAVRDAERDLLSVAGKAPSVRLVDLVVFEAVQRGASDVHIQPVKGRTLVRYRVDGALFTTRELPGSLAVSVVSRGKVMAGLDVAERRAPQDGRAAVSIGGAGGPGGGSRQIDLRVSTLPSTYGERVVMRLLDPSRSTRLTTFQALGMPARVLRPYLAQAARTSGIVLSTGPTGSGKTTTLYATLAHISASNAAGATGAVGASGGCELNMMTIEDPVEYDLSASGLAVSQTQVDSKKSMTFATGLRHILRQDPDVIMVGEIRDPETARIAVQASLTGHLVLSTLHTGDAPSAVVRLVDLGVEPFLVASSLSAVLAQRLVRTVHAACGGAGCAACMGSGFRGRTGVFELMVVDARVRSVVVARGQSSELKGAAVAAGMVPLREAGLELVRAGVTTVAEVSRAVEAVEEDVA